MSVSRRAPFVLDTQATVAQLLDARRQRRPSFNNRATAASAVIATVFR
jgi:hypothetical protein